MSEITEAARNMVDQGKVERPTVLALIAQAEALERIAEALEKLSNCIGPGSQFSLHIIEDKP